MIRPDVERLPAYTLHQPPHRIKLNQNESPVDLPRALKEAVAARLLEAPWSRYPAVDPDRQRRAVAAFAGWRPEGTLLGNGSNELLQVLFSSLLERGATVVLPQPGFGLYRTLALAAGADVVDVPLSPPFRYDPVRIADAARSARARLVVLCSPNNPTGSEIARAGVLHVLENCEAVIAVDEAYAAFSGAGHAELLATADRLVILRSFSKSLRAAGIRFGYALCNEELARGMRKLLLPYNVNLFTLLAVEAILEQWHDLAPALGEIVRERERMHAAVAALAGVHVYPSGANFLLLEFRDRSPGEVFRELLADGILVRDVSGMPMLERCLRITIGLPGENDAVIRSLRRIL